MVGGRGRRTTTSAGRRASQTTPTASCRWWRICWISSAPQRSEGSVRPTAYKLIRLCFCLLFTAYYFKSLFVIICAWQIRHGTWSANSGNFAQQTWQKLSVPSPSGASPPHPTDLSQFLFINYRSIICYLDICRSYYQLSVNHLLPRSDIWELLSSIEHTYCKAPFRQCPGILCGGVCFLAARSASSLSK